MAYFELVIAINEPVVEIMSDFLLECGFTGVITEDNFINRENDFGVIKAYASKNDLKMTKNELKTLIFDKKKALFECGFSENHTGSFEFSLNLIEDESWAENWKKYWDVQKIGNRTVICPSWLEYEPKDGEFKITLDPGCAFGTGTHPTTRLCVRALEEYVFEEPSPQAAPAPAPVFAEDGNFSWPTFVAGLKGRVSPSVLPYLNNSAKVTGQLTGSLLTLYTDSEFTRSMLNKPTILTPMAQALGAMLGTAANVNVVAGKPPVQTTASPTAPQPQRDALDDLLAFGAQFDNITIQ